MPTIYLVRHGQAAGSWDKEIDPGLDERGREQAQALAAALRPRGPMQLMVSPMARTQETATPLAASWGVEAYIEPRVSEIPSPMADPTERGAWLQEIATGSWPEQSAALQQWRSAILAVLGQLAEDTVVVTHFMVINAAVGAATEDARVVSFRPDHCSITALRNQNGRLSLLQRGVEARTRVL